MDKRYMVWQMIEFYVEEPASNEYQMVPLAKLVNLRVDDGSVDIKFEGLQPQLPHYAFHREWCEKLEGKTLQFEASHYGDVNYIIVRSRAIPCLLRCFVESKPRFFNADGTEIPTKRSPAG